MSKARIAVLTAAVVAGLAFAIAASVAFRRDAATLMGLPLPSTAHNIRVELRTEFIGEHQAYIRFEISEAEAGHFFADPFFSQQFEATDPHHLLSSAVYRSQSLTDMTARERPYWWQPLSSRSYFLAYRSDNGAATSFNGPDAAWYAVDKSDPHRYVVYVYLVEV